MRPDRNSWRCAAKQRAWTATNRERVLALRRAWYAAHRETEAARTRGRKADRLSGGLCTDCGEPSVSTWYCWDCLNKREDRRVVSF